MSRRIFIVGCHRTGTTLMRLILNSHPAIHCFDEWKSYKALETGIYESPKNPAIFGFKIPNWTDLIVDSEYHRKFYNNDPIIFMFRDVRDTIASMLRLPTGNGTWFDGVRKEIDQKWISDSSRSRFFLLHGEELKKIETLPYKDYRKASLYWRYKTSKYLDMIMLGWPVLPIRYEFLVQIPKPQLALICQFLQIEWDNKLLNHHLVEHDEVYNNYAVGNTLVDRPIESNSMAKWKNILTVEQEHAILETAGEWNDYVSIFPYINP